MVAKNKEDKTYTLADIKEAEEILNVDAVTKDKNWAGEVTNLRGRNDDPNFINEAYDKELSRLNDIINSDNPNISDRDRKDAKIHLAKLDEAYRLLMDHHVHQVAEMTDKSIKKGSLDDKDIEFRYTRDSPDLKTPREIDKELDREEKEKANSFKGKLSKMWNKLTGNEEEEKNKKFLEKYHRRSSSIQEQSRKDVNKSSSENKGNFKMSAPNDSENTKQDSKNSPKRP